MGRGRAASAVAVALALALAACGGETRSPDETEPRAGSSSVAGGGGSGASGGGGAAGGGSGGASGATGASGMMGTGGSAGSGGLSGESSGGASGASAGRGGNGAGGSAGASAGAGGSAGSSAAGAPSLDCSGTFSAPRVVFDLGINFSSPTLSADETELIVTVPPSGGFPSLFLRSTRASKLDFFESYEPLPELADTCVDVANSQATIDLSADGLRAYIVCYESSSPLGGDLRVATRSAPGMPFVLASESSGNVGASAAIGTGDLTLYSSGFEIGGTPPLVFRRATTSVPFDAYDFIPGLGDLPYTMPDPSADELLLVMTYSPDILLTTRPSVDDPFEGLLFVAAPDPGTQWSSPTISADCRSLYAIRSSQDTPLSRSLEVFER